MGNCILANVDAGSGLIQGYALAVVGRYEVAKDLNRAIASGRDSLTIAAARRKVSGDQVSLDYRGAQIDADRGAAAVLDGVEREYIAFDCRRG